MGYRFSFFQRQQLKQLVLECDILRLQTDESLQYIKEHMNNLSISKESFYVIKRNLHRSIDYRVKNLREHRTAFIEQCFRRIDEIEKYQKDIWATIRTHPKNPYLQLRCIQELHQLTITLDNLYKDIPQYTGTVGGGFGLETETNSEYIQQQQQQEYRRRQAVF